MESGRKRWKEMEQKATSSSSLLASATAEEIIVARILLDLKNLMSLSASLSESNWGCKRKRSCLEPPPRFASASSRPPPSPENITEEMKKILIKAAQEEKIGVAARTSASPSTPLSFSPSESDEKRNHSSKKSSKKRAMHKEDYRDMIEAETQRKELLQGEIEKVRKYYNLLKAHNSKLKAKKNEVLNSGRLSHGSDLPQHYPVNFEPHHEPLAADRTAEKCQNSFGPVAAHSQRSDDVVNQVGPLGIDLNLPATEEAFGLDVYWPLDVSGLMADKRSRFAEARRKRAEIIKTKSKRNLA